MSIVHAEGIETEIVRVEQSAVSAITKSEVEAQLDAAHKYKRSIRGFLNDAITLATYDEEIAASCMYALPRAGKTIEGPSVRLAEICASAYGNMHIGARVVGIEEKEIVAQGVCWDLEKNLRVTIEKRRRITTKTGKRFDDDMITVTGNAAASIGLRDSIFRVIPRAYVNQVYARARAVAVGDASTLSKRRAEVVDRLAKMGVTKDRLLDKIRRPSVDDIVLDDLAILIGLGTGIKDGSISVDEAFPPVIKEVAKDGKTALDKIVDASKGATLTARVDKAADALVTEIEQKKSEIDPIRCDDNDWMDINTAAQDGKVDMKHVLTLITETMGFERSGYLTKTRMHEVMAYIKAKSK